MSCFEPTCQRGRSPLGRSHARERPRCLPSARTHAPLATAWVRGCALRGCPRRRMAEVSAELPHGVGPRRPIGDDRRGRRCRWSGRLQHRRARPIVAARAAVRSAIAATSTTFRGLGRRLDRSGIGASETRRRGRRVRLLLGLSSFRISFRNNVFLQFLVVGLLFASPEDVLELPTCLIPAYATLS